MSLTAFLASRQRCGKLPKKGIRKNNGEELLDESDNILNMSSQVWFFYGQEKKEQSTEKSGMEAMSQRMLDLQKETYDIVCDMHHDIRPIIHEKMDIEVVYPTICNPTSYMGSAINSAGKPPTCQSSPAWCTLQSVIPRAIWDLPLTQQASLQLASRRQRTIIIYPYRQIWFQDKSYLNSCLLRPNNDTRFSEPTVGKVLLKERSMYTEDHDFWLCVVPLFSLSFLFNFFIILALTYLNPLGDSRSVISDDGKSIVMEARNTNNSSIEEAKKSRMVLPFQPLSLTFNHMNDYVDMPVVSNIS
ncbi:hypothetical protein T459_17046 [Capsicum annuum]|uniref:Plant PDR ABC transporter associated domain-containing protein n=1 Tax=Capsicum annuum TaxID=4072 RepID=A0A2G2ZAM9_CAPAN|nr:hypothetical protein T459_17046 [Capsicum annuum]